MSAEILLFETGRPTELADHDRPGRRRRGHEGPLDLLRRWRGSRSRSAQDFHFGAGRPVPGVHRGGAQNLLELAADYLVMAAWLGSEIPAAAARTRNTDGPSAEEMATALANRLRRLEAIREASNRLMNRPQLRRDIFPRGNPEFIAEIRHPRFTATLFDLLTAYAAQRQQRVLATVHLTSARCGRWRGAGVAGAPGRDGRGLEPPRRIFAQLRRLSLA